VFGLSGPQESDKRRDHWNDDQRQDHERKIVLDPLQVAKQEPRHHENHSPQNTAQGVVRAERNQAHVANAGHKGSDGSDDGEKTAQGHRPSAPALEKLMRLVQVFGPNPRFLSRPRCQNPIAETAANKPIQGVAGQCGHCKKKKKQAHGLALGGGKGAAGKQQRIAGQEGEDHDACLDEDDEEDQRPRHPAPVLKDRRHASVQMEHNIDQIEIHIPIGGETSPCGQAKGILLYAKCRSLHTGPMSLRVRLLASFALVLLIPLVTLGLLAPLVYSRSFEEEINGHTRQMIDQVSRRIDDLVADLNASMTYFQTGAQAKAFFLGGNPHSWAGLADDLERFRIGRSDTIGGIALISSDNRFLGVGLHPVTRAPLTSEGWYQLAVRSSGEVRLFSRPIGRNLRSDLGLGADDVVAVVRAGEGGLILFDLKVSQIERIFRGLILGPSGFLFIVDADGNIVYSPVNSLVYRILPAWLPGEAGLAVHRFGDNDYQLQSRVSRATGWRTIGVFSLPEALKEAETLRLYALVSGLAALVLAFFSSLLLTAGFVQPILTLRSLMKRAENGDLNVHFSAQGHDEVGQLGAGFNTMIEEIRHLIEEVAEVQQAKREAELQVLQEQIKPHFLYNTLDTIHWMAQEHGARDITAVVAALTKLFRIGLSRGLENIALSEEIEHVKSYLIIQKVRYEDKFEYRFDVPEGLGGARVLRLILQPLVENAIYHGLKPKRGPGTIVISAVREGDVLLLAVEDDGVGLEPAHRERFNDALSQGTVPGEGAGYGVFNGNERLRLSFGLHYGLRFVEREGGGTRVEVRHPWIEGQGGEDALDSFNRG